MQVKYLHGHQNYQINKLGISPNHPVATKRWDALKRFQQARSIGLSSCEAAKIVGTPKATLYRWQSRESKNLHSLIPRSKRPKRFRVAKPKHELKKRVLELRNQYPTWGKRKIHALLERERTVASESTVGRIISDFLKRQVVSSAKHAAWQAGKRPKPRRVYAVKLRRGQRLIGYKPGQVVQIDHMSVAVPPKTNVKHFNAVCTFSRWNIAEVYTVATAKVASEFVDKLVIESPFKIEAIQVDGGSEFMAEFEEACKRYGIKLAVLAPKSPKLNGHVERINGTWRADFYERYALPDTISDLRPMVADFTDTYNWERPHDSLALQTPQEFLEKMGIQIRASQSQMC